MTLNTSTPRRAGPEAGRAGHQRRPRPRHGRARSRRDSGHTGTAMALAPLAHVLWTRIMRYDPRDPQWPDRDRFVLSCGHACILQYAMLHLTGYDLSLDDLRQFRQWGSRTPGHPEVRHTRRHRGHDRPARPGLRQRGRPGPRRAPGCAPRFGSEVCDHRTFVIAERRLHDGGHLARGGLPGRPPRPGAAARLLRRQPHHDRRADRAGLRRRRGRAASRPTAGTCATWAKWPTTSTALEAAIREALEQPADGPDAKPTLLVLRSHIGWPSPKLTDTAKAHGDPLRRRGDPGHQGDPRPAARRDVLGARRGARLLRPGDRRGAQREHAEWTARFAAWDGDRGAWDAAQAGHGLAGWAADLPSFEAGDHAGHTPRRQPVHRRHGRTHPRPRGRLGRPDGEQRRHWSRGPRCSRSQHPGRHPGALRHPRARHGRRHERHGRARRRAARRRDLLRLLRLHAPRRPAGRAGEAHVIYSWTHDSIGLGEDGPDAPAHRAPGLAAGHAGPRASCGRPTPTRPRRPGAWRSRRTGRSAWS